MIRFCFSEELVDEQQHTHTQTDRQTLFIHVPETHIAIELV